MIHYFPLEHLENRYTTHLDESILRYLLKRGTYRVYYPNVSGIEKIPPTPGMFLNAWSSCYFKSAQLQMLADAYGAGEVKSGDILFFSDIWFPGVEMVRYMDHFCGVKVELRGLLHAGSFTDTDEVRKLERWGVHFETMLFDIFDRIYVGSEFMKAEVCQKRTVDPKKVIATGFPLDEGLKKIKRVKKKPIVVFNGRKHPEKQPWLFDDLARKFAHTDVEFIKTCDHSFTRKEYLQLLASAKVVVSFALQENFGFGLLEAAELGCVTIVPDRLVYPEFFPSHLRYRSIDQCARLVAKALGGNLKPEKNIGQRFEDAVKVWFKK